MPLPIAMPEYATPKTRPTWAVAIFGASSPIGVFLRRRLRANAFRFYAVGRQGRASGDPDVHSFDATRKQFEPPIQSADAVVCCAPLPVVDQAIDAALYLKARRIIAFGSTGRFSKSGSSSRLERDFVEQQIQAERRLELKCRQEGIHWTLFRPTMIYGAGSDLNVAFIGKFIRRFRFFPVPWGATGLRQPVHADDLAGACLAALGAECSFGRSYNLGGAERIPYDLMVCRIFNSLRMRPLILRPPAWSFMPAARLLRKIPRYSFVRMEMISRLSVDLVADNSAAQVDFGYSPRGFHPTFEDICGPRER
jgi:nucleoside-diphosphate-sugar epimerase